LAFQKETPPCGGGYGTRSRTSGLPTQRYEKVPHICRMEPRAAAQEQHRSAENILPKWKLKANWILRQYAKIWGREDYLYTIDFDSAFKDVFVQFFLDEGLLEKDAQTCIMFAYNEYRQRHKRDPIFYTQARKWKWIAENGLFSFLKKKFLLDETIKEVLRIAYKTEIAKKEGAFDIDWLLNLRNPFFDYDYYLDLPCLPPNGHEWVDDPWERLGK
jgi:hypothetical protein